MSHKLNILLPTYSYHPYNYGGTEIYVSGLAEYLKSIGHQVTVIAGMPPEAFEEHDLFFEDQNLKTIEYFQNEIRVIGVILKETNVTDIYRKSRPEWMISWSSIFKKLRISFWDIIHIHANTSAIGISLIKSAKIHSPKIKSIASYHLPFSCVKGTLLFGNRMELCRVTPSVDICSACFISNEKNISIWLSKIIVEMLPEFKSDKLPTNLRIKNLVNEFIHSFSLFDREIDQWHVFSDQIKEILILNSVNIDRIHLLRHGVNPYFTVENNYSTIGRGNGKQTKFLYAGRFDKAKGFITLLKAWCGLQESPDRILVVVGEKQNEDKILDEWLIIAKKRPDIKWVGKMDQQNIAELMKEIHCTIIPSEWIEIGPLVFHEAIAGGSDVLASDLGGCRELGEMYAAKTKLFPAGNERDLRQKILEFKYSGVSIKVLNQIENYQEVLNGYNSLKNTGHIQSL